MDRCDRCNAEAFYHALRQGKDLHFCIHHGRAMYDALVLDGWEVTDDSARINKRPSPSTNV